MRRINHKSMGVKFLLDLLYLGDVGGAPYRESGCLAPAMSIMLYSIRVISIATIYQ